MKQFASGVTVGNGAIINIPLGWIPDVVEVYNATDGTPLNGAFLRKSIVPFSDGGDVAEIVAGETIVGATSGARAKIEAVLLYSGTWAAGDAAGFFVVDCDDLEGTFGSEAVVGQDGGGDATVTANVTHGYTSTTAVAAANASILPYAGVAGSIAKGFSIAAALAVEAKVLRWAAWRQG